MFAGVGEWEGWKSRRGRERGERVGGEGEGRVSGRERGGRVGCREGRDREWESWREGRGYR